ncbi:MAG: DUF2267 domain-containing protein [Vulcanimicrobiaceae bacterium]
MQQAPNVLGESVQQATTWLREISDELGGWMPDDYSLVALRSALHALRDQLSVEQSAHLAAQLPVIVRGIYFADWAPSRTPAREHSEAAFFHRVMDAFRGKHRQPDPKYTLQAVYAVLHRHISPGESEKIYGVLSEELKRLWPAHTNFTQVW